MPQLNVLPVNVSQNIESKEGTSSFDSASSEGGFSQYIDLHLTKSKEAESSSKVDTGNSEVKVAKNNASSTVTKLETKNSDDLVENSNTNDETASETLVQEVAASGKKGQIKSNKTDQKGLIESEQLMSFLTKVDKTLITQSLDIISSTYSDEQLSPEIKAHDEAQLLLNSSNLVADLSAVAKALGNGQVGEAATPTLTEDELLLGNTAKAAGKENNIVKLPVDSDIEGKNKDNVQDDVSADLVKSSEKITMQPEQKIKSTSESLTEVKFSNISSDKINAVQPNLNNPLSSDKLVENDLVAKNNEDADLTAEQKLDKHVKIDHAQMNNDRTNQNVLEKDTIQKGKVEAINNKQVDENKSVNTSADTQVSNKEQVQPDSIKSIAKAVDVIKKQVNSSKESQHEKISTLPDSQLTKNELTPSSKVASIKNIATPNNQLVSGHDDVNKMQAKQDGKEKLSVSIAEQSQLQQTAEKGNEVLVEDKVSTNIKREPSVNSHFIDVSGKATQTPQHIIEQQSVEILNPSVTTEVTQIQKTNTQLHQETISLFRKDFTEAVKDKVMLMISQKLQQFDITLDPPELGNMQVRVNLQGEQAVVNFLVQSQQTKDALEQNMHKLRELLAEQGVDVGDANVEQQSQQSADEDNSAAGNNSQMEGKLDNMGEENDVTAHTLSAKMIGSSTTRVDYYA